MIKVKRISATIMIIICFYFYLLALMKLFPLLLAAPLFFISIVYTVHTFTTRKRFKGFK